MSSKNTTLSYISILCEFLEVAIHNILYLRKVYPDSIFQRRKKYGVIVYQSIHPALNDYIKSCLNCVLYHGQQNHLSKLFLCFTTSQVVVEKYVFDVVNLSNNIEDDSFFVKLEQDFRAFCLKLLSHQATLEILPENTTFVIQLLTNEQSSATFNSKQEFEEFPWVPVKESSKNTTSEQIIPIHSIESDTMGMQIYLLKTL